MPILKIEKLTKKYGKTYALNGLDMEVKKGDIIEIKFESKINKEEKIFDHRLDIIYENDDFMVVNKEANLNTIPSKKEPQKSLYNAIYTYLLKNNKLKTIHIITRLDQKTSGLVLVALNKETALFLNKNHSQIHKIYYARVEGIIKENHFFVESPILKDETTGKRIVDGGNSLLWRVAQWILQDGVIWEFP